MLHGFAIVLGLLALLWPQEKQPDRPAGESADTRPTTRPAETNTILRRPEQADILRNLLGREGRPTPIRPQDPGRGGGSAVDGAVPGEKRPLLLEGAFLIERPGHLVRDGERPRFVFLADPSDPNPTTLELLPNQLLEVMEREHEAGFTEFVISAEVTRYKGTNYLLLRKILRRVAHGNLSP